MAASQARITGSFAGSHTASGKPLLSNDMHLDANRAEHLVHGRSAARRAFMLPESRCRACRSSSPVITSMWPGDLPRCMPTCRISTTKSSTAKATTRASTRMASAHRRSRNHSRARRQRCRSRRAIHRHGPLLNPMLPNEASPCLEVDALRSALNALPLYEMNVASNWTEFSAALAQWCWPTQNVVYSDDQGHVAYHAVGRVPMRPAGLVSVPIQDSAHEWQGYIPFDQMPNAFDPPSGFLATANSRVTTDSSPYPLTWSGPIPTASSASTNRSTAATSSRPRHACRADRHLQRSRPGDGPSLRLRHRPHAATAMRACARPPT